MAIQSDVIGSYRGYDIIKHTSSVGDVIYEAQKVHYSPFYYITCSSDNVEELKKQVDEKCEISNFINNVRYKKKANKTR